MATNTRMNEGKLNRDRKKFDTNFDDIDWSKKTAKVKQSLTKPKKPTSKYEN